MDANLQSIASTCCNASQSGNMSFKDIVATLIEAGFESYTIDFRLARATYFLSSSDTVDIPAPELSGAVAAAFDKAAIEAAIREAQSNAPGYTYLGFCEKVRAAGCAGYMVSFPGKRAVYYGRTAEMHVEPFPQ